MFLSLFSLFLFFLQLWSFHWLRCFIISRNRASMRVLRMIIFGEVKEKTLVTLRMIWGGTTVFFFFSFGKLKQIGRLLHVPPPPPPSWCICNGDKSDLPEGTSIITLDERQLFSSILLQREKNFFYGKFTFFWGRNTERDAPTLSTVINLFSLCLEMEMALVNTTLWQYARTLMLKFISQDLPWSDVHLHWTLTNPPASGLPELQSLSLSLPDLI